MFQFIASVALIAVLQGSVTYYNPGIFEQVYKNRLTWGQVTPCSQCVGMIALEDQRYIGKRVLVQRPGYKPELFLVVDCGKFHTKGRIAEVDWQTAQRWHMHGPLQGVIIYLQEKETTNGQGSLGLLRMESVFRFRYYPQ